MYALFTSDASVSAVGIDYLRIFAFSFIAEAIMFCLYGVLTGAGYTMVSMASSITTSFGIRYGLAFLLSQYTALGFNVLALAYSLSPLLGITVSLWLLASGKWKKSCIVA